MISLRLTDSDNVFTRKVLGATATKLNGFMIMAQQPIKEAVSELVVQIIGECPEIQSVRSGKLRNELGFVSPDYFISGLLMALAEDIEVTFTKLQVTGSSIIGGLSIGVVTSDYSKLLNISEASYKSATYEIPWLNWLLTKGTNVVIANYHIEYGTTKEFILRSRTKNALMKPGGQYSIPSQYAGTPDNNFITRALYNSEDRIAKIIQEKFEEQVQ
jgi:hypothetical protein